MYKEMYEDGGILKNGEINPPPKTQKPKTNSITPQNSKPKCPYCGSDHVIKKGKKNSKQRYKCKNCGKWFTKSSETKKSKLIEVKTTEKHKCEKIDEIKNLIVDIINLFDLVDVSFGNRMMFNERLNEIRKKIVGIDN